jgi:hypothetical protein
MESNWELPRMDARLARICLVFLAPVLMGAGYRTPNFLVTAPTPEIAQQVGNAAEHYRKQLAIEWLGHELPRPWAAPCPIEVKVGQLGAGGQTTFSFFPNGQGSAEVCNWDMKIQGSLERILDSVLPHEISHTIFACHFRRPLPRWADEGAATLAEHESERRQQVLRLKQVIDTRRRIPLANLLNIKDYPRDIQDVMTLYAEGYSLAELLVQEGGRARYLTFLADAHQQGWERAIQTHYGYRSVASLEQRWHDWVIAGGPELAVPRDQQLADSSVTGGAAASQAPIVRGQKPAEDPFLNETAPTRVDAPPARTTGAPRILEAAKPADPVKRVAAQELPLAGRPRAEPVPAGDRQAADDESPLAKVQPPPEAREKKGTRLRPKEQPREVPAAETRSSAKGRQVTEWSEFPQDPRPSPIILPGRNRSGARP